MAEVRLLADRFVEKFVFECSCFFPVVGVLAIVGLRRFLAMMFFCGSVVICVLSSVLPFLAIVS